MNDHLNTIDETCKIQFTYEPEADQNTYTHRPILEFWFPPSHPTQMGVVRTLMERCKNIVTEETDRAEEEEHIKSALRNCGYPDWTFKKVKSQMEKPPKKRNQDKPKEERCRGLVLTLCAGSV